MTIEFYEDEYDRYVFSDKDLFHDRIERLKKGQAKRSREGFKKFTCSECGVETWLIRPLKNSKCDGCRALMVSKQIKIVEEKFIKRY